MMVLNTDLLSISGDVKETKVGSPVEQVLTTGVQNEDLETSSGTHQFPEMTDLPSAVEVGDQMRPFPEMIELQSAVDVGERMRQTVELLWKPERLEAIEKRLEWEENTKKSVFYRYYQH